MARRSSKQDAGTDPASTMEETSMTQNDVATVNVAQTDPSAEVAAMGPATLSLFEWADAKANEYEDNNAAIMEDIVSKIMAGGSVDDVLGAGDSQTISGESAVDRPFLASGFRITRSGYEEGYPWYANINAKFLDTGEELVLNVGAPKILAALKRLDEVAEWPIAMQISAAKTQAGYDVLSLVKAKVPAERPF